MERHSQRGHLYRSLLNAVIVSAHIVGGTIVGVESLNTPVNGILFGTSSEYLLIGLIELVAGYGHNIRLKSGIASLCIGHILIT